MKKLLLLLLLMFAPLVGFAEPIGMDAINVQANSDGTQTYSVSIQVLLLMTALTFLPAMLLTMTSFTRIIIVLAFLRQALGTQQTPSNQIMLGLALFLTFFIMAPVYNKIHDEAVQPYMSETIQLTEAIERAKLPIRDFMVAQTREVDMEMFLGLANVGEVEGPEDVPFSVLIPAFVTSELKTAFQIGFIIFLPFLVIDLVVASTLMSMGMMMLSPMIISLPFKVMLFVLVDGWSLVVGTLASSFFV